MLTPSQADSWARRRFNYISDRPGADVWRSFRADVEANRPWSGDCDDLASTVLDLLGVEGYALTDRYRLFVSTTGRPEVDHMVGAVAFNGRLWVVGDTNRAFYRLSDADWDVIFHQRLDWVADGLKMEGRPRLA